MATNWECARLDKDGKDVFEKTYHPVLVTEFSMFGDKRPLRPNYSQTFGCRLDDAPSTWAKQVRVVVSDLEFM
jgi:hypothetical protein